MGYLEQFEKLRINSALFFTGYFGLSIFYSVQSVANYDKLKQFSRKIYLINLENPK